jgi:hypothetical protein
MTQPLTHPKAITPGASDWMHNRLIEARGILADVPQHPESLVILAARVVAGQAESVGECRNAVDLLRQLDRHPLHAIAAAAFPNGGAA